MARGGQRGEVRHLASGHESETGVAGKIEELEQPLACDLFDHRHRGRRHEDAAVLIPRRRQPIGSNGDRQRAADHKSEVAWPGTADDSSIGAAHQTIDHRGRALPVVAQGHLECVQKILSGGAWADVALRKSAKKFDCTIVSVAENCLINELLHTRIMYTISTE